MKNYGKELIIDLHDCDVTTFTRESLEKYFEELCTLIDMQRCDLHFWDYEGDPDGYAEAEDHLKGISAIQFIMTSNITIHTLDILKKVFINVFSCKDFSEAVATEFSVKFFDANTWQYRTITRG